MLLKKHPPTVLLLCIDTKVRNSTVGAWFIKVKSPLNPEGGIKGKTKKNNLIIQDFLSELLPLTRS